MNQCPKCYRDMTPIEECGFCGHRAALPPVRSEPLSAALIDIRDSLKDHQHVDCNRCDLCRIIWKCDTAMEEANAAPHGRRESEAGS